MNRLGELAESLEWADRHALELMREHTTRAALIRCVDLLEKGSPHREPIAELFRLSTVIRSIESKMKENEEGLPS